MKAAALGQPAALPERGGLGALREPGQAWLALAALLAAASVLAWWLPAAWLDWQPALAAPQPWRAWTAVTVHWSEQHLLANLGAALAVAAFGWAARLPVRATLAWALAWPLTHAALLVQPALCENDADVGVSRRERHGVGEGFDRLFNIALLRERNA